jgi:hypothetical protein
MAASPILAGGLVVQVIDQQSGSFLLAVDRKTGQQRWKTERAADIGWATPMVFRPSKGPAQLTVLGTTRLDSYYLDTGEQRWWMPLASGGVLGTPVAQGGTLLVTTLGSSEPLLPTFASAIVMYDKDHDGRLSHDEFKGDKIRCSVSSAPRYSRRRPTRAFRRLIRMPRGATSNSMFWHSTAISRPSWGSKSL